MATIEVRKSKSEKVSYRVKVRLRGFPAQTASFTRLTDARKWVQQTESAIREGRHFKNTEAKKRTLSQAIDRYIQQILPRKPKSYYDQSKQLVWWKEAIGSHTLANITSSLLAEYRDKLANGITI